MSPRASTRGSSRQGSAVSPAAHADVVQVRGELRQEGSGVRRRGGVLVVVRVEEVGPDLGDRRLAEGGRQPSVWVVPG